MRIFSFITLAVLAASLSGCTDSTNTSAQPLELTGTPSALASPSQAAHMSDTQSSRSNSDSTTHQGTSHADSHNHNTQAPQQATPAPQAPAPQPTTQQPAQPAVPSVNSVVSGYATALMNDARHDGKNITTDRANGYAQCVIGRTYNQLSNQLKRTIASGSDDDTWNKSASEDEALDAAEDYCQKSYPDID